nr:hypothetical protein [Candidatus Njordarchaeota archaeon]
MFSLKFGYLSTSVAIINVPNFIIVVLAGVLWFKEELSMVNEVGIVFGIVSIILVSL